MEKLFSCLKEFLKKDNVKAYLFPTFLMVISVILPLYFENFSPTFTLILIVIFLVGLIWLVYLVYQCLKTQVIDNNSLVNPFDLSQIREKEIRRLVNKIRTGQSSVIVGVFGHERTWIRDHIFKKNQELYGEQAEKLMFSYLDISTLHENYSQAQFWEDALEQVRDKIAQYGKMVYDAYNECQQYHFKHSYLEQLFKKQEDWRLVLMLNRFETLVDYPNLNRREFVNGLRALAASHHPSPLCLIITINKPFKQFVQDTKHLNPNDLVSPFLNFFAEITLGAVSDTKIDELLKESGYPFTQNDYQFIKESAGGHPGLLQIAIQSLIDAYERDKFKPIDKAERIFSSKIEDRLSRILKSWSPTTCQAFLLLIQGNDISGFEKELDELEEQGFIKQNQETEEWQIRSRIFANFMHKNQSLCDQTSLETY